MFRWTKTLMWLTGTCLVVSAAAAGYLGVTSYLPLRKPTQFTQVAQAKSEPSVTGDTVIRLERRFLCGNSETEAMAVTSDLIGLNLAQIAQKYPPADGWEVRSELPQVLVLRKQEWDVCLTHRDYRHLGGKDGFLAIYQGPLGVDETLLQKEDIKLKDLPQELRNHLKQSEKFNELRPETKRELRETLEFQNDAAVNEFLDNLDEYRED